MSDDWRQHWTMSRAHVLRAELHQCLSLLHILPRGYQNLATLVEELAFVPKLEDYCDESLDYHDDTSLRRVSLDPAIGGSDQLVAGRDNGYAVALRHPEGVVH